MDINGYTFYQHYNVPVPKLTVTHKQTDDALKNMERTAAITDFYLQRLRGYLAEEKMGIQEFVLNDKYEEYLRKMKISGGHYAKNAYRSIFYRLCGNNKLLPLSLELCMVPDIQHLCDRYGLYGFERGFSEMYLGILPFSLLCDYMRGNIMRNYQVPIEMTNQIKRFLQYYRTHTINKRGTELDTTTLKSCWDVMRKLVLDMGLKSFLELDGEKGACRIKEYIEKERTRVIKGQVIKYQCKSDNRDLGYMRIFFNVMWKDLGLRENPFSAIDPLDPSPAEARSKILDNLRLPRDKSDYYGRKTVRKQVRIRLDSEDNKEVYIMPCFEKEEMSSITNYIKTRCDSIVSGLEPAWEKMDIRHMMQYHDIIQGDLVLAFGILNGPRPLDYVCCNIEAIGKFSTNIDDAVNERFFNSIPTIELSVNESPYKIRPEKRFFGPIFVIFAHLMKIRNRVCEIKGITIPVSQNSNMTGSGTPLFISRYRSRISYVAITDQFRRALLRVGINPAKVKKSTLYFCRKSFIVYARQSGMPIENISVITGTDPRTLYQYYVYLDMLKDSNKNYADKYLTQFGFEIPEFKTESDSAFTQGNYAGERFNTFEALNIRMSGSIPPKDGCSIDDALVILNTAGLKFSRYLLFTSLKDSHIRGTKHHNKWRFSKRSIEVFAGKYIDAHGVMALYKKRGRGKICKRRALQVITGDLKNFSIKISNRYFVEYQAVSSYLDKR